MTHICQYLRTTLISFPHLWSSVFVKNNRKELVTASLERSQRVPLDVRLDMEYGNDRDYCRLHGCRCFRESSVRRAGNERNLCSHHTAILPLLNNCYTERIRKLDVRLAIANDSEGIGVDIFRTALDDLKFCTFSLPSLESFSFSVHPEFEENFDMHSPGDVFGWDTSPPTNLRHLVLHGYYGGPILSLQNLTSFELAAVNDFYPMEINPRTFLPFISGNTSLVSLTLTHCNFPPRSKLSRVIPIELSQLKTLRLTNISESHSFPYLIEIPALKTLSSLHISTQRRDGSIGDFRIYARGDDGFQLFIDAPELSDGTWVEEKLTLDWLAITHNAGPRPTFVHFERQEISPKDGICELSPLPLFANAEVLEISAFFANYWYPGFWSDLKKLGPHLTTLHLEVTEGTDSYVAEEVKELAEARLKKGMPFRALERMTFEGMNEEDETKAKKLWEEFRASTCIDKYLAAQ